MVEDDIGDILSRARYLVNPNCFSRQAKLDAHRAKIFGAGQCVEKAVGRCHYGHPPAQAGQCSRQIAHDVADAADFPAAQCCILCCQEYDVSGIDKKPA